MKWPKLITIAPLYICLKNERREEVEVSIKLTDLVGNRMIQEQDSLLELCAMLDIKEVLERLWDDMADDLKGKVGTRGGTSSCACGSGKRWGGDVLAL